MTEPPIARYRLTLTIKGNTLDEIEDRLATQVNGGFLLDSDYGKRDSWNSTDGTTTSVMEHHNPDMTPERYAAELDAWWTVIRHYERARVWTSRAAAGSTRRCPMPTREHIEALARALVPDAWDDDSDGLKSDLRRAALRAMGGRVFAAVRTDPAAQDAVLAALVEGGALHCCCAWCCASTPLEQRGLGHAGCRT